MATVEEVDAVLTQLLQRFDAVDGGARALLPERRTIEIRCPDLDLARFGQWHQGRMTLLAEPPQHRADIRLAVRSDDLIAITDGRLSFGRAYASNRVRIDASITDLLRLRSVL